MHQRREFRSSVRVASAGALLLAALRPEARAQGYVLYQFDGVNSADVFGFPFAVEGAGDVDGDGVSDFLAGTPFSDPGGVPNAGEVRVLSGATGALIRSLEGTVPFGLLGFACASAGDVDGDGRQDQVVGAAGVSPPGAGGAGRVLVFSGATGLVLRTIDGTDTGGALGFSVAGARDVNGDGVPDVVAGAPQTSIPGTFAVGRAGVWSGATGALLYAFTGASANAFLGFSVAGPGDLDGDGRAEVAVGAPLSGTVALGPVGQVFVYSGLTGLPLYTLNGSAIADGVGFRLATPGDLNGDGVEDLLAGAPGASPGGLPLAGQALAYSGANGAVLQTLDGSGPADFFGWSASGAGDLDRDGLLDVAVGAPFVDVPAPTGLKIDAGQVKVYSGSNAILTLDGDAAFDEFGSSVAPAGDADADGFPELLVGAPFVEIGSGANVGLVRVYTVIGIPAGSSVYGTGCSGTGGFVPSIETTGGLPTIGHPGFGFVLTRALGGAQAFLFASDVQNVPGLPLGGCTVHIAPGLPYPVVELSRVSSVYGIVGMGGAGSAVKSVPIPNIPALQGMPVYFQWSIFDPAGPNGMFITSNALALTIQ
ncbi:MAG TPA: hypothetical protein VKF62_11960 [Planctomycetota bacterium]|nr:hypothetical protein [Planctomycetota bacterium]